MEDSQPCQSAKHHGAASPTRDSVRQNKRQATASVDHLPCSHSEGFVDSPKCAKSHQELQRGDKATPTAVAHEYPSTHPKKRVRIAKDGATLGESESHRDGEGINAGHKNSLNPQSMELSVGEAGWEHAVVKVGSLQAQIKLGTRQDSNLSIVAF